MKKLTPLEFPTLLREIPDSPLHLYMEGSLPKADTKLLCVVGSRQYSTYGKEVCEKLIAGLAGYNVAIVSGLALGIDGIAHRAALKARLHTVAIPGSGLNTKVLYPSAHQNLAKEILKEGGTLLSEFEPDEPAAPYNFPKRNRIMAGISHAILIIEAAEKSGTLITSRLATDYNREVLVVPGPIYSRGSFGPHMLIRLGATPITKSGDILEALSIPSEKKQSYDTKNISEDERRVLQLLASPCTRDELIVQLNISTERVNVLLTAMEIKGLVIERLGELHSLIEYV